MKVFCRFAPPCTPTTGISDDAEASPSIAASCMPPAMVHVSLKNANERRNGVHMVTITVADPHSGSTAAFTCRRVFFPACMDTSVVSCGSNTAQSAHAMWAVSREKHPTAGKAAKQQQHEVFSEVVQPHLHDMLSGKRCAFLAYGQTATGKTYTMFGPNVETDTESSAPFSPSKLSNAPTFTKKAAEEGKNRWEDAEAGLVPRLLREIFGSSGSPVRCIDLSCVEVYNENATDLVALQLQQHQQQKQSPQQHHQQQQQQQQGPQRRKGVKATASRSMEASETDMVWRAWLGYERQRAVEEADALPIPGMDPRFLTRDAATAKVTYRTTEKTMVMRSALRLRCESAGTCWSLLCALLSLRQRSQTARNVRSSRSHLLLRLELSGDVGRLGEALFVDLAGSESYRDYNAIGGAANPGVVAAATEGDVVRGGAPLTASTFTSNIRDSSGLTAAQRNALKVKEMRHINSSLLALRNVVRGLCTATNSSATMASPVTPGGVTAPTVTLVTTRIPFRDSTLTTILEPFLLPGGESSVAWVVCCSSKQCDFHETVESLRLGAEASAIPACVQLCQLPFPIRGTDAFMLEEQRVTGRQNGRQMQTAPSGTLVQRGLVKISTRTNEDETQGMRNELEAYKRYAQELLEQCNALCQSYDECVGELSRTKRTLLAREREVVRLRQALENALNEGEHRDQLFRHQYQLQQQQQQQQNRHRRQQQEQKRREEKIALQAISHQVAHTPEEVAFPEEQFVQDKSTQMISVQEDELLPPSKSSNDEERSEATSVTCELSPAAADEVDAVRLVESILQRHCVQTEEDQSAREPLGDILCNASSNVEEEYKTPLVADKRTETRRPRVVSFVSPSSHGAVAIPPMEDETNPCLTLPPRSSLRPMRQVENTAEMGPIYHL